MGLAIDPLTGDLDLENGSLYVLSSDEAVAQYLRQSLQLFLGEWFIDQSSGIPYHDKIFVKNPKGAEIDNIFKEKILSVPGIIELIEFGAVLDGQTRQMSLSFRARSATGEINFNETLTIGGLG